MARMTAAEWKKKKEEEGQVARETSATPSPISSDTTRRMTPGEWRAKKATTSVDWWSKASVSLLNETQKYFETWRGKDARDDEEYKSLYERRSNLLAQADSWRKQYADNAEVISYIDSIASALAESSGYATKKFDLFSKFDSEDAYQTGLRDAGFYQEYGDLSYEEIKKKLEVMPKDAEAYEWLSSYAPTVMTEEDYDKEISSVDAELTNLEAVLEEYKRLLKGVSTSNPDAYANTRLAELRKQYGSERDIEALISQKRAYRNRTSRSKEATAYYDILDPKSDRYDPDFKSKSKYVSTQRGGIREDLGIGYGDITYEIINGNTDAWAQHAIKDAWGVAENQATLLSYEHMEAEDKALYNYLYATKGKEEAQKFLDAIQEKINQAKGKYDASQIKSIESDFLRVLAEGAYGLGAGLDQFDTGVKQFLTNEELPTSSTQYASSEILDSLGGFGKYAYSATVTVGNMLPSILISKGLGAAGASAKVAKGAGSLSMGFSSAGNAYGQALKEGYSEGQARSYGVLVGASEATLQNLIGGIGSLGGVTDDILLAKASAIDSSLLRIAAKFGIKIGSEIAEEELQLILEPAFRSIIFGEDYSAPTIDEILETAIVTALSTGALEGPSTIISDVAETRKLSRTGKSIVDTEGGVVALKNLANEVAGVSDAKMQESLSKQIATVDKKATNRSIGKLYDTVKTANNLSNASANQADIAKSLQRKGFNAETANDIAEALVASYNGQELTTAQEKLLKSAKDSKVVQDAVSNIMANEKSTMGQRSQSLRDFGNDVKAGQFSRATGVSLDVAKEYVKGNRDAVKESLAESQYEVSVDGKTITKDTGEVVNIVGIESVKDGKMILKTENGTIDASEVAFATEDEAFVYSAVANMDVSAASAWALVKGFNKSDGVSAQLYAIDIPLAYKYGKLNYKAGLQNLSLTPGQSATAFQMGRDDAAVEATTQASTDATLSEKNADKEIIFEGFTYNEKTARPVQKASMEAIDIINKMSSLEVHVYKSYKKNGNRYAVVKGKERLAPNGYFTDGNKIYIDINAGNMGEGMMLYTLSHEVGHYIARWNAQDFKAISDFLFEHYGKNVPIDKLLNYQKEKLKNSYKADGKPIPSEAQLEKEAHEELVCDMLSRMLADKNAYDKLMELKQSNLKLHQKLGQAIKQALDKLAKLIGIYDNQNPDFMFAASVENFGEEAFRQLQDLYLKAFVQADANFQNAEKNTTEDGGVKYQFKGYAEDGKGIYESNFPKGTPKKAKAARILSLIQDVWSKKPITLKIEDENGTRYITAEFDPTYDETGRNTDASKLMGGNRHGTSSEQRVTLDLADDYYQIAEESTYNYSKEETGKDSDTHKDVRYWHYFINDIYFAEYGSKELAPYRVSINVKEKTDGNFFYSFSAEKMEEISTQRTLHAAVSDSNETATNGDLFNATLTPDGEIVKSELAESGIGFDEETKTVYALRDSTAYKDILTVGRKKFDTEAITQLVAKGTGRSIEDARKWVNSELTIANLIMANPEFLDFDPDDRYDAIKKNSDYPQGTVDLSNLCPKREEFTSMFDILQKKYPNKLFTAQDVAEMRKILSNAGITVACGACFVEDRRQLVGEIADTYINMWKEAVESGKPLQKSNAAGIKSDLLVTKALAKKYGLTPGSKIMATDTYIPNQYDLTTYEGFKLLEKNHPTIAMGFNRYNNSRGQQSARLIEGRAEYKRQILGWTDAKVRSVNNNGGLRIFSFSDFEVVHLLDLVQVIIDCSAKGVKIQGYTKIPAFAKLVRNTGIKLNRSHIPMGDYGYHMENGKVVLDCDTTEGINTNDENFVDEDDNPNVGDVIIGINPTQIAAAMLDPFFDYIIPFHSNKAKEILRKLGTGEWVNYKESQHEKDIATGTSSKHNVNIYTEVINKYHPTNKVEFVEAFLKECKRQGKIPRYAEFLNVDENGNYVYREGYHKLLVDFKMFDKDGNILPQGNITPNLEDAFMKDLLSAEVDKKQSYEFPQEVYDAIDEKFGEQSAKLSDRDNAPTFYSQMAKVVDGLKQEKFGASSIVSTLRGRGVKAEEIKWSGIEDWLEGKKSVTKAELQEFIAGSMLQIDEEVLTNEDRPYSEEHQKLLDEYTTERDKIGETLAAEWKRITGEEFPIRNLGAGVGADVDSKIRDINLEHKKAAFEGRLLAKLRGDLKEVIANNDDFGFDSWKDALVSIHRNRKYFITHYEMSTNDKAVIVKYCNALNAYNEMPNKISDADTDTLRDIAENIEKYNRKIIQVRSNHNSDNAKYMAKWGSYKLKGGEKYREVIFKIPGSYYTNDAMDMHWGNRSGVLAHARVQDMNTFLGKMLFIEEIQSDWHNEGRKSGYASDEATALKKIEVLKQQWDSLYKEMLEASATDARAISEKMDAIDTERANLTKKVRYGDFVPDAPFKDTYHEYVMKRLVREAAEKDYDSIGWTTAETQDERWQNNQPHKEGAGKSGFLKAYTIEYDQNIRNFMDKFGKKWGSKVGKTTLDNGTEVWSMAITDSMKESVLTEGQPLYSDRILMGSLFSGGGTLEAGLVYQMLDKEFAVEYNRKIAATYTDNHGKEHMFVGNVQDFNSKGKKNVFYLHASPVCKNFSPASHRGGETTLDITTAQATARVLEEQMPQVFTVENVKRYIGSEAYNIIIDKLNELGYKWDVDVYKASDYGNATKRERMIIRAVKDGQLPAKPEKVSGITSWGEATRDLWETDLIPSTLVRSKIEAIRNTPQLKNLRLTKLDKPLMIYDTTKSKQVTYAWADELAPTLTTKCGDARIIMPDGRVYEPTPKFMGRIQGLPDDYKYPKAKTNAFKIIGNGIPTQLTKAVMGGVLDSAYEQTHDGHVLYQDRDTESVSNRSLLANAFEGLAQNDIERNKIQEYKGKIDLINAEEKKLRELNEQIKELSFSEGPRDTKKIKALRFDAVQAANRINTYDKQLLRLEASKPLQDVLAREKRRAYKKAEQRGKEALADYKAKVEAKQKETTEKWRESRKTAVAKARETAEKRDARAKLQKLVLDTVKWISYPAKTDVKCPDILKQPYADFLNGIDLSSKRQANGGDPTKNDLRLANAMGSLATALDKIMISQDPTQEVDKVLDTGYLDLPADFVQKLRDMTENIKSMMVEGDYVVNTMTAAEVRQLSQMIRTLNHAIKTMSNLYANLRFANVEALGFDTMEFMDALGEIENTGGMKDFVQWDNALPYYAFKRFGKGGESVFEGLMDAQDKLAYLAQEIFNFQEKSWTGKEAKAWSEDTHTIDLPNGNTLTLTTADAMSIYCLSRREQGLQHLLGGGTRVLGIKDGSKKAKDSRSLLTIKDIDAINSSLTDRQKQVAEAIQEFMSTVCSEWGNEVSMKRFLTKEFTEKFYFPIESNDENLPVKDPAAQQSDLFRLLNISATKPLTPGANNEVIIRNIFDVFTGHASDMARLNAYGMGLLDYMKWLNYREKTANDEGQIKVRGVRKSMQTAYGDAAMGYVLNLVKDVNGRASDGGDPTILMKWMRAAKTASVGNSLRVATLQITSYPRAALVLSQKSLALGLTKKPNIEKAKKYCGIALWKSFGFYDTNISRSIEDQMKGVTDIKQKLIELSLKGAEWGDAITWGALWNACEYEVAKTTKNKVGSEEFYQEVGKKLRDVVYRTQVVDSTLTRSQIMRSKRGMAQETAAFMSEPTLSANILMDAGFEFNMEKRRTGSIKTAWKKTGSYIGKAVAIYSISQLTAALLEALWDAWRDDEDEEFGKKYLDAFVENLALDLVPFNKIPIVSDIFEGALSLIGVGFYSSDKMSSTWITQAVSAVDTWKKVLSGESSATVYNAIYKSTRALSSYFGVAFSGVMREGVALWNNTAGAYDSTLKIRQYDLSSGDLGTELYEAIANGKTRQVDSLKAQFEDANAMHSAVRKALRENDPRIKEAAIAGYNGNPSERVRIAKLIIADGFDQDDVVVAINTEINAMEPDEGGSVPKKKGFYTTEDFAREIANGDQATANAAKIDIIDTAQKNGKTEDQAEESFKSSAKTELKKLYLSGDLSEDKAVDALVTYCDMTETDAELQVESYDWESQGLESATPAAVRDYNAFCATASVPKDVYLHIRSFANNTENDKDANGKSIAYSAMRKVMAEINAQAGLSSAQKTAIARSLGWSDKNIQKYKTW